uniref:Uncharacterized protein n=1 Tax=Globisporangium ultimum (strain ATCC 200006 / CBS 805.95 / DAOM BR144) TaxID=431595 RepID=K3WX77_GLOUD
MDTVFPTCNCRRRVLGLLAVLVAYASRLHGGCVLAAITSASVVPTSTVAGVTGTVDVAFTTGIDVPVGGSILVIFPSAFYVASTTITAITSGLDATSTITSTPAASLVTITVAGTACAAAAPIQFQIDGISNSGAGTTGRYIIRTQSSSGQTIESLGNIAATVITKGFASNVVLGVPNPTSAGVSASYSVSFTNGVELRAGSKVELQFPVLASAGQQFVLSGGVTVSNLGGIDASSTTVQATTSLARLTTAGTSVSPGTTVSVTFNNVINPAAQAIGNVFQFRTRDAFNNIYEEDTAVVGPTITSTTLSSATTITPASYLAGVVTAYTLEFSNAAYLTQGANIVITFPARFALTSASLGSTSSIPTINTALAINLGTNKATLTLGSGPLVPGAARRIKINGVGNPGSSCGEFIVGYCATVWEPYIVSLTDSMGNIFESSAMVPGTPIVKKPLVFGRVRPLMMDPNTATSASVVFDSEVGIPIGGAIEVVFPQGYAVSATTTPSGHVGIPAASTTVVVTGLTVRLTVAGSSIPPATSGLFVIFSGITTPPGDTTGTYVIRTRDAFGDSILEESVSIAGEGCVYLNDCNGHGTCTLFSKTGVSFWLLVGRDPNQ